MVVDIFCTLDSRNEDENGLNIILSRCIGEKYVEVKLVDDGEKDLFSFTIGFKELKEMIRRIEDEFTPC